MCSASIVFLLRRTLMLPDARQVLSVRGCRSLRITHPEFQEWPISFGASGYVALYRLQQDVALVVAVRHQKEVGYQPS